MTSSFTTTKAYLIDLFVICILYGIYLSMFVASLSVLHQCKGNELQYNAFVRRTLVVVAWIICVLETASVIFNLLRCMNHFVDDSIDRVHAEAVGIGIAITYFTLPLGDGIFLYRCWIVWDKSWAVMVLPIIFWLADIAGCVGEIVNESIKHGSGIITSTTVNALVDTMGISGFALNVTLTALITARIWKAKKDQRVMSKGGVDMIHMDGTNNLNNVRRVIIEYGLLWTATHTVLMATSLAHSNAAIIASGIAKHMSGIAFSLMILRVNWAKTRSPSMPLRPSSETRSAIIFSPRSANSQLHHDAKHSIETARDSIRKPENMV